MKNYSRIIANNNLTYDIKLIDFNKDIVYLQDTDLTLKIEDIKEFIVITENDENGLENRNAKIKKDGLKGSLNKGKVSLDDEESLRKME
jgi:hypothetical protein